MFIPFNEMPDHSKIWIYQCNRVLEENEITEIKKSAELFVGEWTAHQQTLHASFAIFHSLFLVVAVDENHNDASGCSIDKSVYFIRSLEAKFSISLFDRFCIAYVKGKKAEVKSLNNFIKMFNDEKLTDQLSVFNNLIYTKGDLKTKWEIPLKDSWIYSRLEK